MAVDELELRLLPSREADSPAPDIDLNPVPLGDEAIGSQARRGRRHKWYLGWKLTLSLASFACIVVFSLNLSFLIWTVTRDRLKEDRGVLYEGDCARVRTLNTVLHLLINILSTALLAASNYGMQCLSAPTRSDIYAAHRRGNYLDIGVPSLRNLRYLPFKRSILWLGLGLSSLPLHLMWVSIPLRTMAETALITHQTPQIQLPGNISRLNSSSDAYAPFEWLHQQAQQGSLERLNPIDCIDAYTSTYQTEHGGLLLVTASVNTTSKYEILASQSVQHPNASIYLDPYTWMCPRSAQRNCTTHLSSIRSEIRQNNSFIAYQHLWKTPGRNDTVEYKVNYCLATKLPERCKLQYSLGIMIAISVANIIKAVLMGYMTTASAEPPMLTTGDAVVSFLHRPDKLSLGKCLVPGKVIRELYSTFKYLEREDMPLWYRHRPKRWGSTVYYGKWILFVLLWLIVFIASAVLLGNGLKRQGVSLSSLEFGTIDPRTLISGEKWPNSMISNTIIANIPQLLFSMLYFNFNAIITSMTLAAEWSRYAITRRGLRVSWDPTSSQRSSYFLSLPYRYAIPLMTSCAILHWLISQSIFLVGVDAYTYDGEPDPDEDFVTCGYTPVAMVVALCLGGFMILCLVVFAFRRFASGMQVAGSCSVAIAAACHPTYDPNLNLGTGTENEGRAGGQLNNGGSGMGMGVASDLSDTGEIESKPLQWGAVPVQGPLGHCAFSDKEVDAPSSRCLYQ
ncbi:hypothetical protein BDW74DRAFT_184630 [Aspergillus multicolor]|uniref:uncharacterized protein n=1 Tax=Aspergillus multicolor TaxID=41759 RepID=UPI003CCD0074